VLNLVTARPLLRLARDLRPWLAKRLTVPASQALVRDALPTREHRFLALARDVIYARPASPYFTLLRWAGCELGDLRALVESDGLEGALDTLAANGVYVTFDELKGRADIRRGSQQLVVQDTDFNNPGVSTHYLMPTGASRGKASLVPRSLAYTTHFARHMLLTLDAHGLASTPTGFWQTAPVTYMLAYAKIGISIERWFHPIAPLPPAVRIGAAGARLLGKVAGLRLPPPEHAPLDDADLVAAWMADQARRGAPVCLNALVSTAVRAAAASTVAGVDLSGSGIFVHSEPLTTSRRATLEVSGATVVMSYGFIEAGYVGGSCANPASSDDAHLFTNAFAVAQRPRMVGDLEIGVDALTLTSLLDSAPKILLNAESGDVADVEVRGCDCPLSALGLTTHLANIRSFEKLTGEGMTLVRTNVVPVLESTLPARFGGTALDYQLVEREGADGLARVSLLVHPRLGALDGDEIRRVFLEGIGNIGAIESVMAQVWRQAQTVEVRREPPISTRGGKVLPFHVDV
jgi:hypothetical protein